MGLVIPLVPRAKTDAESNLAKFIAYCRNDLTAFGSDIDFDADEWDVTDYYSRQGHRNSKAGGFTIHFTQRKKAGSTPFCSQLSSFAKAYVRSQLHSHNSASFTRAIAAFRALDTAIREQNILSLSDCDATVFNKASLVLQTGQSDYSSAGAVLGKIARFLDEKSLVYAPLHNWRYVKARKESNGRVGPEFEKRRQKNLPSQEVLDALAQSFCLATEPRDVLMTSVAAILCSAPERVNEVMVLAEDCETEQSASDGKKYIGLRWAGSKGASDHIKWILPGMADVVRTALKRIRAITEPAREMASWYERNPGKLFLPPEFKHLRKKEILTLDEVGALVNLAPGKRIVRAWIKRTGIPYVYIPLVHPIKGRNQIQAVRFADFEKYITGTLPAGFPIYDSARELKYSESLLVIPFGLFRNGANHSRCMFEVIKYHHIGCALGQNQKAGSRTVFQRVGIDPEGRLAMRSHQFRHWLNTLAQGASLSQLDIAKWSGRASIQQNVAYDNVSSEEIVMQIRAALGDHAKAIGPLAEIPKNLPVTRDEFATMTVPTAHVTLYGFCIHDFTALPCEMFRKCLDCREHVCIKGTSEKTERVQEALNAARKVLATAKQAVADDVYGASDWVPTHEATVERLEQLLAILTDPNVADGAVVQLRASGTYSLSEGALRDRDLFERSSASINAGDSISLPMKAKP
jgi:hypothetical protein